MLEAIGRFLTNYFEVSGERKLKPVKYATHSTGHSISNVRVRGVALYDGTNIQRKQREINMIFRLGIVQPKGLKDDLQSVLRSLMVINIMVYKHYKRLTRWNANRCSMN